MNKNYTIILAAILASISIWYMTKRSTQVTQKKITEIDTIIVGTNSEFKPFSFIENGKLVGVDIDIATEVARRLEKSIKWKDVPFDALIPEIQLGNIHMIAAGMTPTQERSKRILFADPHFGQDGDDPLIVITNERTRINSIDDLIGKEIIVNEGYNADTYLSSIDGIHITRLSTASVAEGMLALTSGRGFAFVAANSSINPFLEHNFSNQFNIFPLPETGDSYALGISKQYPELHKQVDEVIDQMYKDGTIKKILTKWGLQ